MGFIGLILSSEAQTHYRGGRAVGQDLVRVSAALHFVLFLVQKSQTSGDITGNQICVLETGKLHLTSARSITIYQYHLGHRPILEIVFIYSYCLMLYI